MFPILAAFIFIFSVSARDLNVTVDDTAGDERTGAIPQYTPDWTPRGVGGDACEICKAQPNETQAFKDTWHDRSTSVNDRPSTVSIDFIGTRIYVYFILFNNNAAVAKNTRLRFYLDGSANPAGDFLHLNDPAGVSYLYNQLVFDSRFLGPGDHTLLISSYADNSTGGSLALFDYAMYTTDESSPSTLTQSPEASPQQTRGARSSRVGVTIGGSIAGVLMTALLLVAGHCIYSKRQQVLLRRELETVREELCRVRGSEPPAYTRTA